MNLKSFLPALLASATLFLGSPLVAQQDGAKNTPPAKAGKLIRVTEKDAAWAAKARDSYPLAVCVTSDEKLGSMGKAPEYIYRVDGSADRLVMFCCEGCEEDFMKDPAKYVAKLDAAAKAKSVPAKKAESAQEPAAGKTK